MRLFKTATTVLVCCFCIVCSGCAERTEDVIFTSTTTTTTTTTTETTTTTTTTDADLEGLLKEFSTYTPHIVITDALAVKANDGSVADYLPRGKKIYWDKVEYCGMCHIYYWDGGIRDGWVVDDPSWWE